VVGPWRVLLESVGAFYQEKLASAGYVNVFMHTPQ
jgi:hypothetical protein